MNSFNGIAVNMTKIQLTIWYSNKYCFLCSRTI